MKHMVSQIIHSNTSSYELTQWWTLRQWESNISWIFRETDHKPHIWNSWRNEIIWADPMMDIRQWGSMELNLSWMFTEKDHRSHNMTVHSQFIWADPMMDRRQWSSMELNYLRNIHWNRSQITYKYIFMNSSTNKANAHFGNWIHIHDL